MGGCWAFLEKKKRSVKQNENNDFSSERSKSQSGANFKKETSLLLNNRDGGLTAPRTFNFRELAAATKNFRQEYLLGEGGIGCVYKGRLDGTRRVVAVKQLHRSIVGLEGNRVFFKEVQMLSLLHHSNIVSLIGFCTDKDQRLLVYEFMPLGSLKDHLYDLPPNKEPLDWNTRMSIAVGVAKGLEYLHDKAKPPVVHRDLNTSKILLDQEYQPKLSLDGEKTYVSRGRIVMAPPSLVYCAPEYATTGRLTSKSDIYSFGVVLLELITGQKAFDKTRTYQYHSLVELALEGGSWNYLEMADPLLEGRYPKRGIRHAIALAVRCVQGRATNRPLIGEIVTILSRLASQTYEANPVPVQQNNVGPSTNSTINKHNRESQHEVRYGGENGMHSPHRNSPNLTYRDPVGGVRIGETRPCKTQPGLPTRP